MSKKILQIVDTAYRATLEEQDDPVLWLAASLKGNGLTTDVLLRGDAVNYLVRAQDASGLRFGERQQTQPPRIVADLEKLIASDVSVFYVEDDVKTRGLGREELLEARSVTTDKLPDLLADYQQVWSW